MNTTKAYGFFGNLLDALIPAEGEIASRIAGKNLKDFGYDVTGKLINQEQYNKALKSLKTGVNLTNPSVSDNIENKAKKIINNSVEVASKKGKNLTDEQVKWLKNGGGIGNELLYAGRAATSYMTEPGKAGYRWGTYGAVMLGGRIISGGTPLHNNTGERDIAGIPFI